MYTTEAAKIEENFPKHTRRMTAHQIVEYLREHFKTEFVQDEYGRILEQKPLNKSTAYMMAVSNALFDPDDWKAPFRANFPNCGREWAKAAVIWYHGATPYETSIGVVSTGYAC